jgi:hypothetical protein
MNKAASTIVALCAFLFGLRKLDDFDTWWHLAAGRWIAAHHSIPATDTLSHTVRDHAWINLQWGFDLLLYWLHSAGGPVLLSIAAAVTFLATTVLLLRLLSVRLRGGLAALLMLMVIITAQERLSLRPELLSFLLFAAVLLVLDRGQRADGRGLFLLVPLMIVWVNAHALFVLGAFAIVCALVDSGARPSRRLLIWGGAALASVLINPFGLTGALFPLKLLSRIDGSNRVFQTVGEFASPFAAGAAGVSILAFKVMLAAGVTFAVAALFLNRRRFSWGGLILFVGLAALAASARRNVAIFAIGSAPFIAGCLATVLDARPRWQRAATRRAPVVASVAIVAALVAGASVVTGAFYKQENASQEFGAGVIEGTFPVRAAAFAKAAQLPRTLYNDMASGGYLAWADPIGDGVFVDGRLEVYDTPFLTDYVTAVSDDARWQADADRYGIQTAIIFHRFEPDRMLAGRLASADAWSLVYVDEVAAVFVRTKGNDAALARAASIRPEWNAKTDAWLSRPAQKWPYPAGRIEGTRAYARFLATVGLAEPAVAAYLRLVELNISDSEEVERRLLIAHYFASTGHQPQAQEQAHRILAIDPSNAEAQKLLFK